MPFEKLKPEEMDEGAGARVRRLFPAAKRPYRDPFVLFDEFFVPPGGGFPNHPHRGFEAITYVLDGAMHHRDNLGNDSVVGAGGVLRFVAGSGIVHSEMPEGQDVAHGIQLWVNLARAQKQTAASYQQVAPQEIPESKTDGCRVRTVVGPGSPVETKTQMVYLDIELAPGSKYSAHIPSGQNGLVYVVDGEVQAGETSASEGQALAIGEGDVEIGTGPGGRYLLVAGKPYNEPVQFRGPYID
jgi:hypothetical protein